MKFTAENLELEIKVGDTITYQKLENYTLLIIYNAGPRNREQFQKQGVSSHSAELAYKEFVRLQTGCLMRKNINPATKITTYSYVKDKK